MNRMQHIAGIVVAWSLVSLAAGQPTVFRGLSHNPIGGAVVVPLGPQLEVFTNGVTPGGIAVDLTSVQNGTGSFSGFVAPTGPIPKVWQADTIGGPGVLASVSATSAVGRWNLSSAFPIVVAGGGSSIIVGEAYVGDTLVSSATVTSGSIAAITAQAWQLQYLREGDGRLEIVLRFDTLTPVELTGQATVTADRLVIASSSYALPLGNYNTAEVTSDLGVFFVDDARVGVFDQQVQGLGTATISASGTCPSCTLSVGNIGSSGQDGIRTFLEDADGFRVEYGAIGPFSGAGQNLTLSARGTVNQLPDQPIGTIAVDDIGSTLEILSDFSSVGASRRTIKVFRDNTFLGEVTNITGFSTATVPDSVWPDAIEVSARRVPELLPAFEVEFPALTSITLPGGGGSFNGNRLAVIATNPSDPIFGITTIDDQQGDLPGLDVVQQDDDPFCQGDFNNSNTVDLSDLGQLLSNFGLPGSDVSDGDANGDTFITLSDLALVLAAFGSSCNN